ncbi:MAG: polysaccharide deacetylase family protein [Chloroflexota bacterium]
MLDVDAQENLPVSRAEALGWDLLEGDGTLRRIRVPILMYHYVSELPPDADDIRRGLTVEPDNFARQMAYLVEAGYNTVTLNEVDLALETGSPLPPNPVVLTFDDGHLDHYTHAFPILQANGQVGTFFIVSGFADNSREGYMSWVQIEAMAAAGMRMEAHSRTHSDLRERSFDFLVFEIAGSMESLVAHTGIEPSMFAYPVGRYDADTLAVTASAGIQRAVTTQVGTWQNTTNRFEMPRMRVTNEVLADGMAYLLNYDIAP